MADVEAEVERVVPVRVEESFVAAEAVEVLEVVTFAVVEAFSVVVALTTSLAMSRLSKKAMVPRRWTFWGKESQ